jgi:hypothetical protein
MILQRDRKIKDQALTTRSCQPIDDRAAVGQTVNLLRLSPLRARLSSDALKSISSV